jgi:ABC-type glutathione transport system ATPase component
MSPNENNTISSLQPPPEEETIGLTQNQPTLNIDKTKSCHLKWTNIVKTVEIKDQAVGLIRSSIAGAKMDDMNNNNMNSSPKIGDVKVILNQISGEAKPGQILALMGPSGSGKTSLLDVLSSRSAYDEGTIYLNGASMTDNPGRMKSLKRKIAYIKQKDIFFEHLSVKDQLMYTAFLRLGDDYTREQKLNEVDKVIQLLRLEKCADTPIMLVSG